MRGNGKEEIILDRKTGWLVVTRSFSFRGWLGWEWEEGRPVRQIIRQFLTDFFKIPFRGEWKLSVKFQFGDTGLSVSSSILDLLSCF